MVELGFPPDDELFKLVEKAHTQAHAVAHLGANMGSRRPSVWIVACQ